MIFNSRIKMPNSDPEVFKINSLDKQTSLQRRKNADKFYFCLTFFKFKKPVKTY